MKPIIGIFLGETAGVGPELVAKLVADKVPYKYCRPVLIGDARVLRQGMEISHVDFPFTCVESVDQVDWDGPISIIDLKNIDPKTVKIGTVDPASGKVTGDTLVYSMDLLKQHQHQAHCQQQYRLLHGDSFPEVNVGFSLTVLVVYRSFPAKSSQNGE